MRSKAVVLLVLLAGRDQITLAAAGDLPADLRAELKALSGFQLRATIDAIPGSVRESFARAAGERSFSMAQPGGQWQSTDAIMSQGLPRRRLTQVALSNSLCILFYEHGGRGYNHQVAVFRMVQDRAELLLHAISFYNISDPAGFLTAVDNGPIVDYESSSF